MELGEIAERCARRIDEGHLSRNDIKNNYPAAVAQVVGTLLGGGREVQAFYSHMQQSYFSKLFGTGSELETALTPTYFSGGLVWPTFTCGGRAYVESKGVMVPETFLADVALESMEYDRKYTLDNVDVFGADVVLLLMAFANKNYNDVTWAKSDVWGYVKSRLGRLSDRVTVGIRRGTKESHKKTLMDAVEDESALGLLLGDDCQITRDVYRVILENFCGMGPEAFDIVHEQCEVGGDECKYLISLEPQVTLPQMVWRGFAHKFGSRGRLLDADRRSAEQSQELQKRGLVLQRQKRSLEVANEELRKAYERRNEDYNDTIAARRAWVNYRGAIHDLKDTYASISLANVSVGRDILSIVVQNYPHLGLTSQQIGSLTPQGVVDKLKLIDFGMLEGHDQESLEWITEDLNGVVDEETFELVSSSVRRTDPSLYGSLVGTLDRITTLAFDTTRLMKSILDSPFTREKKESFDYSSFWGSFVEKCKIAYPNFSFDVDVPAVSLSAYREAIDLAFWNQVRNAVEEMGRDDGGTITVRSFVSEDKLHTCVYNPGSLVPESVLEKLRSGDHVTSKEGGTGTGTQIAWDVFVTRHGGVLNYRAPVEGGLEVESIINLK
jgi:hypothetical protein